MAMSHKDRFKLKSDLVEEFESREWTPQRINLLFAEFGIGELGDGYGGPNVVDLLATVTDATLVELYAVVFNLAEYEVSDVVEPSDQGNWNPGQVRLFISHSAKHKAFVSEVGDELAVVGIHGFVAHETMAVTKPWQEQIEQALRSMHAFVAFIHPEFLASAWCHQETGWALGRRVPYFAVRLGVDPVGFLGRTQWPNGNNQTARQVAATIADWVVTQPGLGPTITDGLFTALSEANDYYSAEAASKRIVKLGNLSVADLDRLDQVYWNNNQVHGGVLANRVLEPFYKQLERPFPPTKPAPSVPPQQRDPWADAMNGEPPF